MTNLKPEESAHHAAFGQRKVTPRVCIADNKKHLRTFLAEVLEDLGFVTCECAEASEKAAMLDTQRPDLVVLGLSSDGIEAGKVLEILAEKAFGGSVLAIGLRDSIMVRAVRQLGEEYGIAMLPPLLPPFSAETLRAGIAAQLPLVQLDLSLDLPHLVGLAIGILEREFDRGGRLSLFLTHHPALGRRQPRLVGIG